MHVEKIDFSELTKLFSSKDKFYQEAFLALSIVNPKIKIDFAVLLYKEKKVSLAKAAEIAGMSFFEFEKVLEMKGIKKHTYCGTKKEVEKSLKNLKELIENGAS
jgi:predicted HTH domain antitoxin